MTPEDAVRLAKQATFGPDQQTIDHIVALGSASAWIDEQMTLKHSTYEDLAQPIPANICTGKTGQDMANCNRDNYTSVPMVMRFYKNAIGGDDQLRQRTAFALSQILVASDLQVHITSGLARYNQILMENAFGNYRDILASITTNPFMGNYLSMAYNNKFSPNENYARELFQLFSIGTAMLNADGTPQSDASGTEIAAYTNSDVKEAARALTGWVYAPFEAPVATDDYTKPMIPSPTRFDAGAKTFLNTKISANATQQENVNAVIDAVFNHPNCAPFVSKRLIQQLVVANPSPAYVKRVATVFINNGSGVRGDLKAVIKAILTDPEARSTSSFPGKLKEPVLLATSLARAIGFTTDGYAFYARDAELGQRPFSAPSVFNYYPYNFPLPQGQGLVSPTSKLMTTAFSTNRHNLVYDWTIEADQIRSEFQPLSTLRGATGTQTHWSDWEALGQDQDKLLDRINLLLLNGTMTATQRQSLSTAMASVKDSSPSTQIRKRVQVAFYIVASSPMFQVDR